MGLADAPCWRMSRGSGDKTRDKKGGVGKNHVLSVFLSWHSGKKEFSAKALLILVLWVKTAAGKIPRLWRLFSFSAGAGTPEKAACPWFAGLRSLWESWGKLERKTGGFCANNLDLCRCTQSSLPSLYRGR